MGKFASVRNQFSLRPLRITFVNQGITVHYKTLCLVIVAWVFLYIQITYSLIKPYALCRSLLKPQVTCGDFWLLIYEGQLWPHFSITIEMGPENFIWHIVFVCIPCPSKHLHITDLSVQLPDQTWFALCPIGSVLISYHRISSTRQSINNSCSWLFVVSPCTAHRALGLTAVSGQAPKIWHDKWLTSFFHSIVKGKQWSKVQKPKSCNKKWYSFFLYT